jgi:hypothetical protein
MNGPFVSFPHGIKTIKLKTKLTGRCGTAKASGTLFESNPSLTLE